MATTTAESLTDRDKRLENVAKKLRNRLTAEELEALYRHVPKKTFCAWTGLRDKTIDAIGARYGWPVQRGSTVAPPDILASVFEWAKTNSREINKAIARKGFEAEIGLDDGQGADWQDKCYEEKFYTLRDQRKQREGEFLPRQIFRDFMQEFFVEPMQRRLEILDKRGDVPSAELAECLREDIKEFAAGIEEMFSVDDDEE